MKRGLVWEDSAAVILTGVGRSPPADHARMAKINFSQGHDSHRQRLPFVDAIPRPSLPSHMMKTHTHTNPRQQLASRNKPVFGCVNKNAMNGEQDFSQLFDPSINCGNPDE